MGASQFRKDFYNAVAARINSMSPDVPFAVRWLDASTSAQKGTAIRGWVEPEIWRVERVNRAQLRRTETIRVVVEGTPQSSAELQNAILTATELLEEIATAFLKRPELIAGAFCQSAEAFGDAAPLYDPGAALDATPSLFSGVQLTFFWIV